MRAIAAILISIVLGAVIEAATISYCITNKLIYYPSYSGGVLPMSDPKLDLIIDGFLGGLFGLFCGVAAWVILKNAYVSRFNVGKFIFLPLIFGLVHSAVMAWLEYDNAVYGKETSALSDFQQKIILTTAVVEFITGVLIGLASVLIISVIVGRSSTRRDQPT